MEKKYITPECEVLIASVEGMLCASEVTAQSVELEQWQEENFNWN